MKNNNERKITIGLFVIGIVYFALMIFPNFTGAKDINMLAVFEKDEFAQLSHVVRMLTPGETLYETLRHFFVYIYYFYGYPFSFFSAIMLLPYRLIAGADWASNIPVMALILRQLVNVLPMIVAIALMVRLQTKTRPLLQVLGLFVFMLAIPAVIQNNLWWHPDSLAILLVVLTFYFIDRDAFRFGRNFFLAAVACGIGFSVKFAGAFFVLAIPAYLVWGVASKRIAWRRAFLLAFSFVLVMFVALLVTNPLLLLPQERQEIISIHLWQFGKLRTGYYSVNPEWNLTPEKINRIIWPYYAQWFTLIVILIGLAKGIASSRYRLLDVMILLYGLPYFFTAATSNIRPLYFLPMMIPLASCLAHLFPESVATTRPGPQKLGAGSSRIGFRRAASIANRLLPWLFSISLLIQFFLYLRMDVEIYQGVLYREERSPSIAFYGEVEKILDSLDIEKKPLVIYRDLTAYVPPKPDYEVLMRWKLASYDYINSAQPDVLLLEMDYILAFTKPDAVETATDVDDMIAWQKFYGDAYADQLPGYSIIFQNEYALALIRDELLK